MPGISVPASPAHAGMHPIAAALPGRGFGFPRTRGDAPREVTHFMPSPLLPPHTRGCTLPETDLDAFAGASPAHAGMHPAARPAPALRGGFPRTRGDAPVPWSLDSYRIRLPPHTRGCTRLPDRRIRRGDASPAHAGMHLFPGRRGRRVPGFPRTRGDAPPLDRRRRARNRLPPHTRGCTRGSRADIAPIAASPAHAGMHPAAATTPSGPPSFPRTRGDAPCPDSGS